MYWYTPLLITATKTSVLIHVLVELLKKSYKSKYAPIFAFYVIWQAAKKFKFLTFSKKVKNNQSKRTLQLMCNF